MLLPVLGIIILVSASLVGGYSYWQSQKVNEEKRIKALPPMTQLFSRPSPIIQNNQQGSSPLITPSPFVMNQTETNADWKTYTNSKYEYEFKYPAQWTFLDEGADFEYHNRILSMISVSNNTYKFGVWVDENKPPVVFSSPDRIPVKVSGIPATAYVFPQGAECGGLYSQKTPEECSFFEVPILKNNLWYRLGAVGNAQNLNNIYGQILSTFTFTR